MPAAALAALAAALCWTLSSLLWRRLRVPISAVQLNQVKNLLALALQLPLLLPAWRAVAGRELALLLASGVLGIALGDSFFFAALRRLGTRRTLTIEAAGPALTTVIGAALLQERPQPPQLLGVALISAAVLLVAWARPQEPGEGAASPPPDPLRWRQGVCLALVAVVCGSLGALLARAALRSGQVPPLQASSLRLLAACLTLLPLYPFGRPLATPLRSQLLRAWPLLLPATLLGTSAGIALQQTALAGLPGGLAVALLSTAPVMALPLGWILEGDRPDWRGVAAGLAAVVGVSLVALSRAAVG